MPLAPNTENYLYPKGHLLFQKTGTSGLLHLGNVPDFGITLELSKEEHYSAMQGTNETDKTRIKEKKAKATISLEEFSAENVDIAFLGDGVNESSQAAGTLDAVETTTVSDKYVELDKYGVYSTKISHGAASGGPFTAGETITGGTSSATAKIAWVGSGFVEVINVTGTFQAGETITGGTSSASATASSIEIRQDVVVTDDDETPTKRYTLGTDYSLQPDGGLIRELSGGSIASNTCYVSADYGAKTLKSINALVNSSTDGKLLYIGTPEDGPKSRVDCWKCELTVSGEVKKISDSISSMPIEVSILSDRTNHPDNPFFKETLIE